MELILNLAWVLVAAAAMACWAFTRSGARDRLGRQLLALGVLLVVLFPAISITDDLWAAHNPAETDVLLRRCDHARHSHGVLHHSSPPFLASSFQPQASLILGKAAVPLPPVPFLEPPSRFSLFIRPPPVL